MVSTITELKTRIDAYLDQALPMDIDQPTLKESMCYSVKAGGKRLRPALTLATIEMLGKKIDQNALRAACALELLHTYSLIHDDLRANQSRQVWRGDGDAGW